MCTIGYRILLNSLICAEGGHLELRSRRDLVVVVSWQFSNFPEASLVLSAGIHLQVDRPHRLLRFSAAFTLTHLLVLPLGQYSVAEKSRPYFEVTRRQNRHGTCKAPSAFSLALYLLSDAKWSSQERPCFLLVLACIATGHASHSLSPSRHEAGGAQAGCDVDKSKNCYSCLRSWFRFISA